MKDLIFGIAILETSLTAWNNSNKPNESQGEAHDSVQAERQAKNDDGKQTSINIMVNEYLQIKNALAEDNGNDAAAAGRKMVETMG